MREGGAIEETRDRYFIQLLKRRWSGMALEGVFYPFKSSCKIEHEKPCPWDRAVLYGDAAKNSTVCI